MEQIGKGGNVLNTRIDSGYESNSSLRDVFAKIFTVAPKDLDKSNNILKASCIDTQLGPMMAIGDETSLYLLEFLDRSGLEREIEILRIQTKSAIIPGTTSPLDYIQTELEEYFVGKLKEFKTPIAMQGSIFQKLVWDELLNIPYGETRSYLEEAIAIARPTGYRAVANANGANKMAIIIPCHRIINNNGEIGGYAGGVVRKKWLLEHEKKYK